MSGDTAPPRGAMRTADPSDEAVIEGISIDRKATAASLRTIAMPADTNPNGDIFGGWILSQMDLAGGTHAVYEAKGRVATVAVTAMKFHQPVIVGDEVSCYCATTRVGRTSITVLVETWVRRRRIAVEEQVTEGLFTFVAIDANGRPRPVREPEEDEMNDAGSRGVGSMGEEERA